MKTDEEKAKAAYDKQEKLIEQNRQKQVPATVLSKVIRWAYRSKINESVYCMNADGYDIPAYQGKFADQGSRILADAPADAEFYTSFSGAMNFIEQTREQWGQGL